MLRRARGEDGRGITPSQLQWIEYEGGMGVGWISLLAGKGLRCAGWVVGRRRGMQLFPWSFKLLSMAAILCFSQHCLTWNFRAEDCRTVFTTLEGGREAKKKRKKRNRRVENSIIIKIYIYSNIQKHIFQCKDVFPVSIIPTFSPLLLGVRPGCLRVIFSTPS